jgi:hypothetical protein
MIRRPLSLRKARREARAIADMASALRGGFAQGYGSGTFAQAAAALADRWQPHSLWLVNWPRVKARTAR